MRRHRQLLRALCLASVVAAVARRMRAGTGRQPALRHRLRRSPAGRPETTAGARRVRRPSRPPRTTCPGATARHGCSAAPPSRRRRASRLDCASYDADLDPISGASGTLSIGVVRAKSAGTPADAGPLVMTTGTDLPSSVQLPVWLSRNGTDVLKTNPIVAVDRRGIGTVRRTRLPRPLRPPGDARPGAVRVRRRPRRQPERHRADRDHQLHRHHRPRRLRLRQRARRRGHRTAAQHLGRPDPGRCSASATAPRWRWPTPGRIRTSCRGWCSTRRCHWAIAAEAAAEQQVKGQQAALDAFAAQCAATACPLGPDPKGAVNAMLAAARERTRPRQARRSPSSPTRSPPRSAFPGGDRVGLHQRARQRPGRRPRRRHQRDSTTSSRRPRRCARPTASSSTPAATRSTGPPPTGSANSSSRGASSTRSSAAVGALNLVELPELAKQHPAEGSQGPQDPGPAARRAERPDRRQRGRGRRRRDHHQRGRRQPPGDVAGRRPRRQHLLAVRPDAGASLPGQRQAARAPTRTAPPSEPPPALGVRCAGGGTRIPC